MGMNVEDGAELIVKAIEKRDEERAWQLYLTKYPYMTEEDYIPFDTFYNPNRGKEESKSAEDILEEVKKLLDSHRWG